ncbi:iron-containing alcohol dehydrogenase [Thalassotalea atypica]|uniref:iron-containing alcohol dehydrogenase n=1 Tax=Thalassotalea atypica TaxID=2054316 RepID=UPI0025730657|nr:iron-containing alcohol dehydrogenase [Thalassotalea atypica]
MSGFEFNTTKSIISEVGCLANICTFCESLNIANPLIVTDQGIVNCGLLAQLESLIDNKIAFTVFDDVVADPLESVILSASSKAELAQIDGVIGFGGGSSMDTAKLVAVLAKGKQKLSDMYGVGQVNSDRLPLILIPTTAGTGSEVTPIAIVTTGETTKAGIVSPILLPDIALLDAQLTTGLPSHITAATGIDAMVHAIEAYTSKIQKNPYSDMLAKEALRLLSNNIETACIDGNNLVARQNMLLGACIAGQAFANAPVAAVHALAYPLGGHFHISHGLSNSLVLPHVMRFNLHSCAMLYSELAPLINPEADTNQADENIAKDFISAIEQLIKDLLLPTTLKEMNIKPEQLPMLAKDAMLQQRLLVNNPRELTYQDALNIYYSAYGEL